MGTQSSHPLSSQSYTPDLRNWKTIGEGQNYQIWRNTLTNQQLEEYIFTATDSRQFATIKKVFEFRYQKDYIVSSRYFKEQNNSEICSTFYQGHTFIERIPLRLNEIKDLPFPDSIHLMNNCLRGFRELYHKTGSFEVSNHMIGINCEAKVKVWLNNDFGKSRSEEQIVEGARQEDERRMVSQIISLIDRIVDHRTQTQSLTEFISKGFSPNFDESLIRLEEYLIKYQVAVPPYLISIALLRDRGYFKKMTPRLGASVDGARLTEMRIAREQDEARNVALNLGHAADEAFVGGRIGGGSQVLTGNYQVPIPIAVQAPIPVPVHLQAPIQVPAPVSVQMSHNQFHQIPVGAISHPPLQVISQPSTINNQNLINTTSAVTPFQAPVPFRFAHKNHQISGYPQPQPIPALVSVPNQIQLKVTKVTSQGPQIQDHQSQQNNNFNYGLPHRQQVYQKQQYVQPQPQRHQPQIQYQAPPQQQTQTQFQPGFNNSQQQKVSQQQYNKNNQNAPSAYPSETGSALDRILEQTKQLGKASQQPPSFNPSIQSFTIYNTKNQTNNQKPSTPPPTKSFASQDGYTNPELLKHNVKDYSSNQSYNVTSSQNYSTSRTEGGTDPSLLSKAVAGILNLIDKKPQSSYQTSSSNKPYSYSSFDTQQSSHGATSPDLLSKMLDFKSTTTPNAERGSVESSYTFTGGKQNNENDLLTTLLVGGIIAAPEDRLKELVGSGPNIMSIINESKKGFGNTESFGTATFGGGSFDSTFNPNQSYRN